MNPLLFSMNSASSFYRSETFDDMQSAHVFFTNFQLNSSIRTVHKNLPNGKQSVVVILMNFTRNWNYYNWLDYDSSQYQKLKNLKWNSRYQNIVYCLFEIRILICLHLNRFESERFCWCIVQHHDTAFNHFKIDILHTYNRTPSRSFTQ